MVLSVLGWSLIICVVTFGILIASSVIISFITDLNTNKPANVFLGSLGIIAAISFIVSISAFIIGQDDLAKNHLESIKTGNIRTELLATCPHDTSEVCKYKWHAYRADSIKTELQVRSIELN